MGIVRRGPGPRSITAAAVGAPNSGKSSLVNRLVGADLAVVCPKPQTTRNAVSLVLPEGGGETVLVDTPGLFRSNREFDKRLAQQAVDGARGARLLLAFLDPTAPLAPQLSALSALHARGGLPTEAWAVLTKADRTGPLPGGLLRDVALAAKEALPSLDPGRVFPTSARTGEGARELLRALREAAPPGGGRFGPGSLSDKPERFFAAEYVREQLFRSLDEELPYECAVVVDLFREGGRGGGPRATKIAATVLVSKASQRAIVVGSGGRLIKAVGARARKRIEAMVGGRVALSLHVKVSPGWRRNNRILESVGLPRAEDSNRVWRKRCPAG